MWTKSTTIWCDEETCDNWIRHNAGVVGAARKFAREKGWVASYDGDYCPDCKEDKGET